jgi:hypothetical protein
MASADKPPSKPISAIVLILLVGVAAFAAAYWWLTRGGAHELSLSRPTAAAPVAAASSEAPTPVQTPTAQATAAPVAQAGPLDPEIASDAAAAGLTSRIRPANSPSPGQ